MSEESKEMKDEEIQRLKAAIAASPHVFLCQAVTVIEGRYPTAQWDPPQKISPRNPPNETLCNCWKAKALTSAASATALPVSTARGLHAEQSAAARSAYRSSRGGEVRETKKANAEGGAPPHGPEAETCSHCGERSEPGSLNDEGECLQCEHERENWEANTPEWKKLGMRSMWE